MANLTLANNQRGVVLIAALIMVVAVTGIAVTLMSSASVDIKITNAALEREEAENILTEISDWLEAYWADEERVNQKSIPEVEPYQDWSFYKKHETYTVEEVRKILKSNDFILPKVEELSELVKLPDSCQIAD